MLNSLVFWGLLPIIAPQALRIRRDAPRFAGAAGPTSGVAGAAFAGSTPLELVAVGDSIVAGVGASVLNNALVGQTARPLSEALQRPVNWSAIGLSGATTAQVHAELVPRLGDTRVDVVLVSVGVNDVTDLTRIPAWRRQLLALFQSLSAHSPRAIIVLAGVPPLHKFPLLPQPMRALFGVRARAFDRAATSVCVAHRQALYVPFYFDPAPEAFAGDGYHPSEASYTVLGEEVATKVLSRMGDGDR